MTAPIIGDFTTSLDAITNPAALRALRADVSCRLAALYENGTDITPGRRIRLVGITPVVLINLTGHVQAEATGNKKTDRLDVLLDESSTEALRRDHRVDNTRRATRPADTTVRQLLTSIPVGCMILADGDS